MVLWSSAAATLLVGSMANAQATPQNKDDPSVKSGQPNATPPKKSRSVRKGVVDLEQMAKERRLGQVMPGDPAPVDKAAKPGAEEGAAPTAEKGGNGTIALPDTAPKQANVAAPAPPAQAKTPPGAQPPAPSSPPATPPHSAASAGDAKPIDRPAHEPANGENGGKAHPAKEGSEVRATPMEGSRVMTLGAAAGLGPARVRVLSVGAGVGGSSGVQWRGGKSEAWSAPAAGEALEGDVEIRVGLDGELELIADNLARVRVSRLGRVIVQRCAEQDGSATVGLTVSRGAVEVRPAGAAVSGVYARVQTPDQRFGLSGPLRVEYDAFAGTRGRAVNP
jgi:hypothetical protein